MDRKEKPKMTDTIKNIVNTIIKPYGINFFELLRNKMSSTKKYFTISEAERYSALSRWTLGRAIKAGELVAAKLSDAKSGKVLIKKEDLDRYIESHTVKPSASK